MKPAPPFSVFNMVHTYGVLPDTGSDPSMYLDELWVEAFHQMREDGFSMFRLDDFPHSLRVVRHRLSLPRDGTLAPRVRVVSRLRWHHPILGDDAQGIAEEAWRLMTERREQVAQALGSLYGGVSAVVTFKVDARSVPKYGPVFSGSPGR